MLDPILHGHCKYPVGMESRPRSTGPPSLMKRISRYIDGLDCGIEHCAWVSFRPAMWSPWVYMSCQCVIISHLQSTHVVIRPVTDAVIIEAACDHGFNLAQRKTLCDLTLQIDAIVVEVSVSLAGVQMSGEEGERGDSDAAIHDAIIDGVVGAKLPSP